MKLIYCPDCEKLMSLGTKPVSCLCGGLAYLKHDGKAYYHNTFIPLLIKDTDLVEAIRNLEAGRVSAEDLSFTIKIVKKKNVKQT